ncbi:Argonaute/Dicer protein, PAZ [Corchorus olitorius]|uniref:Argonaute/Dicer protein, PAZ n=1 Tax=Corchorus olitorius TaxID=93759 RepID=A0A1R3J9K4_9ROSI|nr:Argonaute/Dicer protein, PAZ [Corchorus olitorius]
MESEPAKKKVAIARVPMARRGLGSKGQKVSIQTNHFKVNIGSFDGHFFHYNVSLFYEDDSPVDGKGFVGRRVIDKVQETYSNELAGNDFAYDGQKSLFALGPLPSTILEFTVVLENVRSNRKDGNESPNEHDGKRLKRVYQSKTFKVEISFASKVPIQAIQNALHGQESENSQEALRVVDIILRQNAARQGCLLVRQSFFQNNPTDFADIGDGVLSYVSTSMIIQPGPVENFLKSNQNVNDFSSLDWHKAKRMVKNLRIKVRTSNQEYKITGLSEHKCFHGGGKLRMVMFETLEALRNCNYGSDPMLRACDVTINPRFTQVEGRVLPAPKELVKPVKIEQWAVVNFSELHGRDTSRLVQDLTKSAEKKGIHMEVPFMFHEKFENRHLSPVLRVDNIFKEIIAKHPKGLRFLLCLLPERKNSHLYGPWKRKTLTELDVVTQCMAPIPKMNDQYFTNLLLKINAKLGGLNSMLAIEQAPSNSIVSQVPTIILGMDVSHGPLGQSDVPSIAAVVSSRQWPLISRYRASVRTQSPRVEMIDSLFNKKVSEKGVKDEGVIRELLLDFYSSSGKRRPDQIIIFRDGVSESQFNQVLEVELQQIIEACKFLEDDWNPKFLVIVAQKNHHTRFFQHQQGSTRNVPPGTVIDNEICHPEKNDFYLCAHAGVIGTSRPTHYHVLLDQIGISADDLQELVHSLSYVYQRSTTAISVVAPVYYAHLAAAQMGSFMKSEGASETSSSSNGGVTVPGDVGVPEMPRLTDNVCNSMFFC